MNCAAWWLGCLRLTDLDGEAQNNSESCAVYGLSGCQPSPHGSLLLFSLHPDTPVTQIMAFCPYPWDAIPVQWWPTCCSQGWEGVVAEMVSLLQEFEFVPTFKPESGTSLMPSVLKSTSCQSWRLAPQRAQREVPVWELKRTPVAAAETCSAPEGDFVGRDPKSSGEPRAGAAHRPPEQPGLELEPPP